MAKPSSSAQKQSKTKPSGSTQTKGSSAKEKSSRTVTPSAKRVVPVYQDMLILLDISDKDTLTEIKDTIRTHGGRVVKSFEEDPMYVIYENGRHGSYYKEKQTLSVKSPNWVRDCVAKKQILEDEAYDVFFEEEEEEEEEEQPKKKRRTAAEMNHDFSTDQMIRRGAVDNSIPPTVNVDFKTVMMSPEFNDMLFRKIENILLRLAPQQVLLHTFFLNEWYGIANLSSTSTDKLKLACAKIVKKVIAEDENIHSKDGHESYRNKVMLGMKRKYGMMIRQDGSFDPAVKKIISDTMKEKKRQAKNAAKTNVMEDVAGKYGMTPEEMEKVLKDHQTKGLDNPVDEDSQKSDVFE